MHVNHVTPQQSKILLLSAEVVMFTSILLRGGCALIMLWLLLHVDALALSSSVSSDASFLRVLGGAKTVSKTLTPQVPTI